MSNEIARWFSGTDAVERQQDRELAAVEHAADLAEARVAGINRVTKRAMYETMLTNILRARAEQIAPDGAELYAMIAVAGAVESAKVINDINRRGVRR
jgi:hypothetical protein